MDAPVAVLVPNDDPTARKVQGGVVGSGEVRVLQNAGGDVQRVGERVVWEQEWVGASQDQGT